jgi:ATP-dependent Clp protease ATP-binding subunit ClpA
MSVSQSRSFEIIQQGGKVSRESESSAIPEGFTQLMDQMKELVNTHQQNIEQQRVLLMKVMERLSEALENFKGGTVDLKPLEALVEKLTTMQHVERPTYEFHVERNSRGFMTGMTAKPSSPTIN